jgi:hypothetical protein
LDDNLACLNNLHFSGDELNAIESVLKGWVDWKYYNATALLNVIALVFYQNK